MCHKTAIFVIFGPSADDLFSKHNGEKNLSILDVLVLFDTVLTLFFVQMVSVWSEVDVSPQ